MKKVMVFAAHPDDDILGCGGSIAKHLRNDGCCLRIVYMTSGDAGSMKYSRDEIMKIREEEAVKGAAALGAVDTMFLRNPDGRLVYDDKVMFHVASLIREYRPNIVYTHHSVDNHTDHLATNAITTQAAFRAREPFSQGISGDPWAVNLLLAYEIGRPMEDPSYIEDITDVADLKFKALTEHKSQMGAMGYDEAIKGLNRHRGVFTGTGKYAEAFKIIIARDLFQ